VSGVVEVLRRYARQQASKDDVMRALVEHDDWFAPVGLLPGDPAAFEQLVTLDSEGRAPEQLWLFTDEERARAGRGHALGVYGGPLPGPRVFEQLADRFPAVEVNPGSSVDERWTIARAAYRLATGWARAVGLERAFRGDRAELVRRLGDYDEFMVLVAEDNSLVRVPLGADDDPFGLVFTTPDFRDACVRELADEERRRVRSVAVRGTDLFPRLAQLGVRGVIVNATAPDRARAVIPLELAEQVRAS
jgi:hypothetical protein